VEGELITDVEHRTYTVDDVKRSYPPDKAWAEMQGELPLYVMYRPISIYLTPFVLALGVPILAVTLFSLVIATLMPAVAFYGGSGAYLVVAFLAVCFHVCDCLDGNMARTTDQSSRFGGLVDGSVDMVFWAALFLSMGLLVSRAGGGLFGGHAIAFSLGLAVLVLLSRQTRDNFTLIYGHTTYFVAERPARLSLGHRFLIAVVGLETLYAFAIGIGCFFGVLDWVLLGIGVYVVLMYVGTMIMTFRNAAVLDGGD